MLKSDNLRKLSIHIKVLLFLILWSALLYISFQRHGLRAIKNSEVIFFLVMQMFSIFFYAIVFIKTVLKKEDFQHRKYIPLFLFILIFITTIPYSINTEYGKSFLKSLCDNDIAEVCNLLAETYDEEQMQLNKKSDLSHKHFYNIKTNPGLKTALKYYEKACNSGSRDGCYNAGRLHNPKIPLQDSLIHAKRFYSLACDKGHAVACSELGSLFLIEGDYSAAKSNYEKGCSQKNIHGCYFLGRMYFYGYEGAAPDKTKSKFYLEKSCSSSLPDACELLNKLGK